MTFVVVMEGIDCSGKTTQLKILKERLEEGLGAKVGLSKALPDGILREAILGGHVCDPKHIMLLYRIAMEQHFREVAEYKKTHDIVLCDRSYLTTRAYQGYGMELNGLMLAMDLLDVFSKSYVPDIVVYFSIPYEVMEERLIKRSETGGDYIERLGKDFFIRTLHGFETMMTGTSVSSNGLPPPRSQWSTVPHLWMDGTKPVLDIHDQVWGHLKTFPAFQELLNRKLKT